MLDKITIRELKNTFDRLINSLDIMKKKILNLEKGQQISKLKHKGVKKMKQDIQELIYMQLKSQKAKTEIRQKKYFM